MTLLTKSKYLYGLQCLKLLWVSVNDASRMPPVDSSTQAKFDIGHEVGELAKRVFLSGVDVPTDDFMGNVSKTKELIFLRKTIFEAGVMVDGLYSRADVLRPNDDGSWDIIEVKSSTDVKDVNIDDLSFQRYVYSRSGLKIGKCFLMHINNQFVKDGEIDANKFFTIADVTSKVDALMDKVPLNIQLMLDALNDKEPGKRICKNCSSPYECALTLECFYGFSDDSVFDLYKGGAKCFELYDMGVSSIKDIPSDFKLTDKQSLQRDCSVSGKPYVDKASLKHFLSSLKYPLSYMDFETFMTAIPIFDGTRPYQQIPFQFSLHTEFIDGTVKHYEYLHDDASDPRLGFITALKEALIDSGTILVYFEGFEKSRLKELSEVYPEFSPWVNSVLDRIIDLLIPFRNFHYYNPKQQGSASIKKVLPAITGKGYEGMEIGNGGAAMQAYYDMTFGDMNEEEKKKTRENLLKYCGLDTEGMIWIKKELEKLIKKEI